MSKAKRKNAKLADPQKDKLYAWEECWREFNLNTLTLKECRQLVRAACDAYKLKYPRVVQHKKRSLSYSISEIGLISLQAKGKKVLGGETGGKNLATALHEAAHYITDKMSRRHCQPHGPTFLRVYLQLLVFAGVAPAETIYASARKAGLKWRKN